MPVSSPIAHAAVGYVIYAAFRHRLPKEPILGIPAAWAWPPVAIFLSLLPDADAAIGIPLHNLEHYHNNLTHSLLVGFVGALVLMAVLRWIARLPIKVGFWFALTGVYGHILIDLLTDSRGTMLLWPFSVARFGSPITIFTGVPWSHPLTDPLYLETIFYDCCFAAAVIGIVFLVSRRRRGLAQLGRTH
jgi:membrane-bound metal-dependent hydrolase YbcI (DUF457 family)